MVIKELVDVIRQAVNLPEVIEHNFVDRVNFKDALKNKKSVLVQKGGKALRQQDQQGPRHRAVRRQDVSPAATWPGSGQGGGKPWAQCGT